MRLYLHRGLGLRFGFANATDFDFLIPAPVAFALFVYALESARPIRAKLNRPAILINLSVLALFLVVNYCYESLSALAPIAYVVAWATLLATVALTSFCWFVTPREWITNPNRIAILPCVLIGSSLYFYQNAFRDLWMVLGEATSLTIHALFSWIPFSDVTAVFTPEDAVRIDHPLLSVRISQGCGGGDAFFFFTLAFLLAMVLRARRSGNARAFTVYVGGLAMMFVLNIIRIVVLFFGGIALRRYFGIEAGTNLFKALFHLHFGWLIYAAGIAVYLGRALPWIDAFSTRLSRTPSPQHLVSISATRASKGE